MSNEDDDNKDRGARRCGNSGINKVEAAHYSSQNPKVWIKQLAKISKIFRRETSGRARQLKKDRVHSFSRPDSRCLRQTLPEGPPERSEAKNVERHERTNRNHWILSDQGVSHEVAR